MKKNYPDKYLPVYTTQAPLEIISFFDHMWHEANEQKQSSVSLRSAFDSTLPEPLLKIWSSRLAEVDAISLINLPDCPRVKDYEILSNSPNFEDEHKQLISPSFSSKETSDIFLFEQCSFADIDVDSYEDSQYESLNIDFPIKPSRIRANSTDYAYSEANEASRAVVASLKTTKAVRNFLKEEEQKENEPLRLARDELKEGRQNLIVSKPKLNIRDKRHEQQKDSLVKTSQRDSSMFNSRTLRPKAYSANSRHMGVSPKATSGPSKSSLEEFKIDRIFLSALSRYI